MLWIGRLVGGTVLKECETFVSTPQLLMHGVHYRSLVEIHFIVVALNALDILCNIISIPGLSIFVGANAEKHL